jgi:excisionase family DNA binding protein
MDTDATVLTVPEAAKVLRLSRAFAYQLVAEGELPSLRLGRRVLIPRAALEQFIEASAMGPNSSTRRSA